MPRGDRCFLSSFSLSKQVLRVLEYATRKASFLSQSLQHWRGRELAVVVESENGIKKNYFQLWTLMSVFLIFSKRQLHKQLQKLEKITTTFQAISFQCSVGVRILGQNLGMKVPSLTGLKRGW